MKKAPLYLRPTRGKNEKGFMPPTNPTNYVDEHVDEEVKVDQTPILTALYYL